MARDRPWRGACRRAASPRGCPERDCRAGDRPVEAGWRAASSHRPTGVIAVFSDLSESMREQLATRGIPYVVVDPTVEPLHDTPLSARNWNGGLTATRHLCRSATGGSGSSAGPSGSCAAARGSTHYGRRWTRWCPTRSGPREPREVPSRRASIGTGAAPSQGPATAIFAGNDLQAPGVYRPRARPVSTFPRT